MPEAWKALDNIDQRVRGALPGVDVRWAYTSGLVRDKLAKEGKALDSPAVALSKMLDQGFTDVTVQSLHVIPGQEYHDLLQTVNGFRAMPDGFARVRIGWPLLARPEDIEAVVDALLANAPKDRKSGEALVFMGHGTHHPADVYYLALQYVLGGKDPLAFVATVEGTPSLDDLVAQLKAKGVKKAYLAPLMAVAGDHANNDMAGEEPDSWKSVLARNGVESECLLRGLGEDNRAVDLWLAHLKAAMAQGE